LHGRKHYALSVLPSATPPQHPTSLENHALAGADSTLVFTVEDGKVTDAAHKQAIESALDKVKGLNGVAQVADPFAEGGAVSEDGTLAAVDVRYDLEPAELEKEDGEALLAAAETAEQGGVEVNAPAAS
jgi:RND superfamily putative drug exporter